MIDHDQKKVILGCRHLSSSYEREFVQGVTKYSAVHGLWTLFHNKKYHYRPDEGGRGESSNFKRLDADGIISQVFDRKQLKALAELDLPIIVDPGGELQLGEKFANLPLIACDDYAIGKMAAEHLLKCKLRNFACFGFEGILWHNERCKSFAKVIEDNGFETHLYETPSGGKSSNEHEVIVMANWLESLPKRLGLMACNDDCAQLINQACKVAGLHVPNNVAIIGVTNDNLVCDLSNPPLTSIALNTERTGYQAAALLDKLMRGKEKMDGQRIMLEPTYVVPRQSTDILAIEDEVVAKAVQFIREHADKPIQTIDVCKSVGLPRSSLTRRFQEAVGITVCEQIRYVHAESIARLLIETDLSITEISRRLGCGEKNHLARYFRQVHGVTPSDYRKKHTA